MKIVIKTTGIKLNQAIKNFVEEKINSLEKFSKIFGENYFNGYFGKAAKGEPRQRRGKPRAEAWVEVGKITRHHQKGPIFRAECQMRFPGKSLRAEVVSKNLKSAIVEVKDELQRQLKQYKEKNDTD